MGFPGDSENQFEDNSKNEVLSKFEKMLEEKDEYFFDASDFELIVDFYMETGDHLKAMEACRIAQSQHPLSTIFLLKKAEIHANRGEYTTALGILDRAELAEPFDPNLHLLRAGIACQEGKHEEALESYRTALKYSDEQETILMQIANEHQHLGNFHDAELIYKKIIKENPDNEEALYDLVFCMESKEQYQECIRFIENFIDSHPYSYAAWYNLGVIYSKLSMLEKAIDAFDYVTVIKEDFIPAYFNKATAYAALEKYTEAIKAYEEIFQFEHPDALTCYFIAECYERNQQYDKALSFYNKAIKLDPQLADAWIGIGIVMDYQNRLTEGIHYIKKALELESENPDYWYVFAEVEHKLGFIDEAESAYKKVIDLDPSGVDIWLDYSGLLFHEKDMQEAVEAMAEGIKHNPDAPELFYRMAAYLFGVGDTREAMSHLENALQLDFSKHDELFDFQPSLKENKDIIKTIELYRK